MTQFPGLGVMISILGGNEESVNAIKQAVGQTIESLNLDEESNELRFGFTGGYKIALFDDGQSCCEHRYMRTDDDLTEFVGAKFLGARVEDAEPAPEDEYGGVDEIQLLVIETDRGNFVMTNHNDHNGYYGGFSIRAKEIK